MRAVMMGAVVMEGCEYVRPRHLIPPSVENQLKGELLTHRTNN